MPGDPDNKLDALALSWMAASRVADLKASADELAGLVREIEKPLSVVLPADPTKREWVITKALLSKDQAARRLLSLVASGL